MEKKTMGSFLAALRKTNGMTQKDLAEQLNVSDKTVSRWERDEGVPDLSLIPVLAEIFGITCDELLRGERKSPEERLAPASTESPKGEKQRRHLLAVSLSKYKTRSFIAMGLSVAGLIAAFVGNFGFLRAYIGFFVGAVFFLAAVICQAAFVNAAFLAVEDEGPVDDAVNRYKRAVIRFAQVSLCLTAVLLFFCLPLMIFPQDTYAGLGASSWFLLGALFALIALAGCGGVCMAVNTSLLKRGVFTLTEKETATYHYNHKLKRIYAVVLVGLLAVTFVGHQFATSIWGPYTIMEGTTFEDYESFIEYMEQDIPASPRNTASLSGMVDAPVPEEQIGPTTYYDEYGNEISEEEALTRRLKDRNGNIVCQYIDRNESVVSMQYTLKDGTILPITVFTDDDLQEARQTAAVRHVIFGAAACIEILAVVLVYFRKRAK